MPRHSAAPPPLGDGEELLTVAEVCGYLRLKRMAVYALIDRGELPAAKIGRGYRITRSAIDELTARIAEGKVRTTPEIPAASEPLRVEKIVPDEGDAPEDWS